MNLRSTYKMSLGLSFACALCLPAISSAQSGAPRTGGIETNRDLPGSATKYYGQRVAGHYRDPNRRIAKIDLDGDLNYDGIIDNHDPADNGLFEVTPPGLQVGVGEMTRVILRVTPYRIDFAGQAIVSLSVDGINRSDKSGLFASLDEEIASTGRIRVWGDPGKTRLILDSADPGRRVYEWVMDHHKFPANLPGTVPRTLYVEGVTPSGSYMGDVRLLLMIQHRDGGRVTGNVVDPPAGSKAVVLGDESALPPRERSTGLKRFSTSYDHMLFTVRALPQPKEFVVENGGVWIPPAPVKGGRK